MKNEVQIVAWHCRRCRHWVAMSSGRHDCPGLEVKQLALPPTSREDAAVTEFPWEVAA